MPVMGFTWVIGLLAVGSAHEALAYVFIVLNSLQVSDVIQSITFIFKNIISIILRTYMKISHMFLVISQHSEIMV